jgi:hypothetical protein
LLLIPIPNIFKASDDLVSASLGVLAPSALVVVVPVAGGVVPVACNGLDDCSIVIILI